MMMPGNISHTDRSTFASLLRKMIAAVLVAGTALLPAMLKAQDDDVQDDYEEISVFLMVQGWGGYDMNVLYLNDRIYVPVTGLFSYLKINNVTSPHQDTISGFFLEENNQYSIRYSSLQIIIGNTDFPLDKTSLIKNEEGLFLRSDYFGKLFGLNLTFNFRTLTLELKTNLELPVIKELRLEQIRQNISALKGEIRVDTTIGRKYHALRGGMADWSVISTQASGAPGDVRAGLALGTEFLGGETNLMLNYSSQIGFDERQQQYRWRWANNDARIVRQVTAGKLVNRSVSSIYAPVIGVSASNTPTTFRKSFGSYELTDYTEPGWTVELYINNVIVDFTTADASGFYRFEVPLVYGTSQLLLKFYGPWGEERSKEQTLNIPYNFLPKGEFEYNAAGGIIRDSLNSRFARAESNYGINRNLSIGAGYEYNSSVSTGQNIPFVSASARFFNNFIFSGEYDYGVRTKGLLNYRLPSNFMAEIEYVNYVRDQEAISFNYLEERKASLSVPLKMHKVTSFARMSYKQNVLKEVTYSSAELLYSTFYRGVSANISGFANWLSKGNPYIYSTIALGFKVNRFVSVRPQAQIDLTNNKLISAKVEVQKNFFQKAYLSMIYEENFRSSVRSFEVSFRYELPFAQTNATARLNNSQLMTTQSARGSLALGSGNGYVYLTNRTNVGRGGLSLVPFLDINHNNHRDPGEPKAGGLSLILNGGQMIGYDKDSIIRIVELEPYASYLLELSDHGFDNIAWQLDKKTYRIEVDPNQFKLLEIPVFVMGEVNGWIYLRKDKSTSGQGRILVNIYDAAGNLVSHTMSEMDGFFSYLGLSPGHYTIAVDKDQLERLGMVSDPERSDFEIRPLAIGDIVDDLTFTITPVNPDPAPESGSSLQPVKKSGTTAENERTEPDREVKPSPAQKAIADAPLSPESGSAPFPKPVKPIRIELRNVDNIPLTRIQGNLDVNAGKYFVQAGAFSKQENALNLADKLCPLISDQSGVVLEEGLYKLRFGYFSTEGEARTCAARIASEGYYTFIGIINY